MGTGSIATAIGLSPVSSPTDRDDDRRLDGRHSVTVLESVDTLERFAGYSSRPIVRKVMPSKRR
ncbi:hypothetical protein C477_04929 [Haloterrigena salina JCM 13891]|uniref:Uncharacterized protein n=1 Tax=Haloterrigena salina JCM 13891 TaxID=1227488 RepID=M0CGA4_9EURY|nr:hypothetical protein C477_04929 [Haloterrigena salina JCM 13891]